MRPHRAVHAFAIPEKTTGRQVLTQISREFQVQAAPSQRIRLRYLDTFDWRLYNGGWTLVHADTFDWRQNGGGWTFVRGGDVYRLHRQGDDAPVASCKSTADLGFWWEYPEGRLRDRLRRILGVRRAMVVGAVGVKAQSLNVLNADGKIVLRARIDEGGAGGAPGASHFRLVNLFPMRGYRKEARRVSDLLVERGLTPAAGSTFDVAVRMNGREPGDYSSKLDLALDAAMTAQEAARVVFARLLDTIERNVPGILADVDTEFLHDFRVATRRSRAGLRQLKKVFPEALAQRYRARFADVGRGTNRLRDLDVFLLDRERYCDMLAPDLRPALDAMFSELAGQRERELAAVRDILESEVYRELARDWRETLGAFGTEPLAAERASLPVGEVARHFIRRRYARVLDEGSRIGTDAPDAARHALRIRCKRLRYLLEFFASLFPGAEIEVFIKQLKRLQDNLGEYNDLVVQQGELRSFLRRAGEGSAVDTITAVGALIGKLEDRQQAVRHGFPEVFAAFTAPDNRERFTRLVATL